LEGASNFGQDSRLGEKGQKHANPILNNNNNNNNPTKCEQYDAVLRELYSPVSPDSFTDTSIEPDPENLRFLLGG
jgi:hypothetical protein